MKTQWRHRIAATAIIAVLCLVPLPAIASTEQNMGSDDYWGTERSLDLQADGLWIDGITHKILFAAATDTTIKAYVAQKPQGNLPAFAGIGKGGNIRSDDANPLPDPGRIVAPDSERLLARAGGVGPGEGHLRGGTGQRGEEGRHEAGGRR